MTSGLYPARKKKEEFLILAGISGMKKFCGFGGMMAITAIELHFSAWV
ncbi:hypothetical protein C163_06720 [Pseudomonas sp. FGI182]|nr:hypothetical protein C163_06720 [Pseudomonas sp. FGI182]